MFSRRRLISLFFLIFLSNVRCSLQIGEAPRGPTLVANKDMVCVRDLGKGIDKYLDGELKQSEIYQWAACVNDAIYNFDKYTEGEDPHRYTVSEVAKTVGEVVFPDKKISEKLVSSAMAVKKYLVGGDSRYVTREELKRLQDLVWTVKDSASLLNPHIPILNLKVRERPHQSKVDVAGEKLFYAIHLILHKTDNYRTDVDFNSINEFIVELQKFNDTDPKMAKAFTDLAKHFYNTITGLPYDNNVIEDKYSELFFKELSYWYRLRLTYVYHVKDKRLLEGEGLPEIKYFIDQILNGTKRVIERYEHDAYISYEQIDALVDGFYNANILPNPFRGESIKEALRAFFNKVFGDRNIAFSRRISLGIDQQVIAEIEAEFYKWYEIQNLLMRNFEKRFQPMSKERYVDFDFWPKFLSAIPQTASHYIEIKNLWENSPLRYQWGNPRMAVGSPENIHSIKASLNFYQLSLLNMTSSAVRLVSRGYAQDLLRAQKATGLTESELDIFINDFRLIWEDLNIMPPGSQDIGKKMFIETNLFAPSGNGIQYPNRDEPLAHLITYNEGVELLAMLYSGYTMNKNVFSRFDEKCLKGPKDVFGKPMFVSTCYWQNFKNFYSPEFTTMPGIEMFLKNLDPNSVNSKKKEEWESFISSMDKLIRHDWEPASWISSIQMGKATMILHYIETMINKFDINYDGYISETEGLKAYSHFRGILDRMAKERCKELDEEQLQTVYLYILKYAKVPGGKWEAIWDEIWTSKADKVDHLQILKIFRQILASNSTENTEESKTCVYKVTEDDIFGQMIEEAESGSKLRRPREINELQKLNK